MKIIVDAFGGDNAPKEILKGCAMAVEELDVDILLTGDETKIKDCAAREALSLSRMEIVDTPDVMDMHENPKSILKERSNTSMAVGLKSLAQGLGDAFVSAGSTGALAVGATFLVKRIKGVKRAAIGSLMPSDRNPFLLMDCGANVECRAEMLHQFAMMGNVYMKKVMRLASPRVGLVNVGEENTKGAPLQLEAYELMKQQNIYNFVGNIEARQIPFGDCDVVIADGFTGNVVLKLYEGVAGAMMGNIKAIFKKSLKTKLGALLVKEGLTEFKNRMDYKEYGGAALLGISKPVIKAHGSSDARSFKNAIRQAVQFTQNGVIEEIAAMAAKPQQA